MIDIKLNEAAFARAVERIEATPAQVVRARASALRKMRKRIETMVKRAAAKELRMPQKVLGRRFYSDPVKRTDEVLKVWIGTHPVSPFSLGKVRPYGKPGKTGGVKAGRRTYRGAFIAAIYSSRDKVWIRKSSKHYSPELYPTRKRAGDRGLGELRGRFPVVRAAVPIDEVVGKVVSQHEGIILAEYRNVFVQDLNYFANIRPVRSKR